MESDSLSKQELERYQRHISLEQIGQAGQLKLKNARVLVIGAGGLGCPALLYLTAAGIGRIGIVDSDKVELSNLQRQVLFSTEQVSQFKASAAKEKLSALNPLVQIDCFVERLGSSNIRTRLADYDIIVDGSDNFATRYLVNDACVVLGKPLVAASIFKFEGQLSVFNCCGDDGRAGPTYRCLFPEPPAAQLVPACGQVGVLGVLPGIIGALQANEVLKLVLDLDQVLSGKVLILNALSLEFSLLKFERNDAIVRATKILSAEEYKILGCGGDMTIGNIKEITPLELKQKLDAKEDLHIVDVREAHEREICNIGGALIPLGEIADRIHEIPRDKPTVVYCRSGGRSGKAVEQLQAHFGFSNLSNLSGGILRWIDEVDGSLTKY